MFAIAKPIEQSDERARLDNGWPQSNARHGAASLNSYISEIADRIIAKILTRKIGAEFQLKASIVGAPEGAVSVDDPP